MTRLLGSHLLALSLSCHPSYPSLLDLTRKGRTVRPRQLVVERGRKQDDFSG